MTRQPDYYVILGVAPDASPREIARAYRSLVRRRHPDSRPEGDPQAGLADIYDAYAVLRDPARRADYDRSGQSHDRAADPRAQPTAGWPVPVRVRRQEPTVTPRGEAARGEATPPRATHGPTHRPAGPSIWVGPTITLGPATRPDAAPDLLELLRELRRRSL